MTNDIDQNKLGSGVSIGAVISEPVQYESVPTIEDYERRAFEAARRIHAGPTTQSWKYGTFEAYQKSEEYPK
jgi:hypothetical protein